MNAVLPMQMRRAVSPYARRLARERGVALPVMVGSGPLGRVVAADVLGYLAAPAPRAPEPDLPLRAAAVLTFSAAVSLAGLYRLAAEAERVGLVIAPEDAAARAAARALEGVAPGLALEVDGRQVMVGTVPGLSVGAERRQRRDALDRGADASATPAAASLLVLEAGRIVPLALPILPGRRFRFVLFTDSVAETGQALLCADGDALTPSRAAALLGAFVAALEHPLALLA